MGCKFELDHKIGLSTVRLVGSADLIQFIKHWSHQLSTPTIDACEVTLERSARGFILALLGSFLFANNKGLHVHLYFLLLLRDLTQTTTYNWGSAILAHLYGEFCQASCDYATEIVGCMTLLQILKKKL